MDAVIVHLWTCNVIFELSGHVDLYSNFHVVSLSTKQHLTLISAFVGVLLIELVEKLMVMHTHTTPVNNR